MLMVSKAAALICSLLKFLSMLLESSGLSTVGDFSHGGRLGIRTCLTSVSSGMFHLSKVVLHLFMNGGFFTAVHTLSLVAMSLDISSSNGWVCEDIRKYVLQHISCMCSNSGGKLASACSAALGEVLRAPMASRIAAFWIVSSLSSLETHADATAVMPYVIFGLM